MFSKTTFTLTTALALLVPVVASAQSTQKEEAYSTLPNRALFTTGAMTFGVPYTASVLVAASTGSAANNNLYVPVVGPWLTLGQRHCTSIDPCDSEVLTGTLLAIDGAMQGIGVLTMAASLFVPEAAPQPPTITLGKNASMNVAPAKVGTSGYGVSALGSF
jgi:hypothetical protein